MRIINLRKCPALLAWLGTGALVVTLALAWPAEGAAQRGPRGGGMGQMGPRGMGPRRERMRDQHPHQPGFFERLRDLPPAEQERVLQNDRRFRNLPPERQERIRENLRRWNALTPEQKEQVRERQRIFASLTPQQRQEARALAQQWRELPPERRHELQQAFRHLRDLPPGEREKFLSSPEVHQRFSPEEQRMLRGLGTLLPEGAGGPPEPPGPEPDQ